MPLRLRNAPTALMKGLDYGKGYRYAHDEAGGFAAGERYWPDRDEEKTLIFPEQEPFKRSDPWEDLLDAYVNGNDGLHVNDPAPLRRQFFPRTELYQVLQIKPDRVDNAGQMDTRISNAMKSLGFKVQSQIMAR